MCVVGCDDNVRSNVARITNGGDDNPQLTYYFLLFCGRGSPLMNIKRNVAGTTAQWLGCAHETKATRKSVTA